MKKTLAAISLFALLGAGTVHAQNIQITPNGTNPSSVGDKKYFSGHAVVNPLYPATAESHATFGEVAFAPGARTAWHTHPAGQMLIVTDGKGWVQQEGEARRVINPGDVVWIPAGVKHWHGATDKTSMSHIAVSYMKDGSNVTWQEQVSDKDYSEKK
ncbi:(R)-mandelonitrile lyase [Achromobacter xylosoxidans]